MEVTIILLIVSVIIFQVIDRIQIIRIEDKIDELNEEIKVLKNDKDFIKFQKNF